MVRLFDRFTVFKNRNGEFEVANENEIVMTNRETGVSYKQNICELCDFIKAIFPDREEQEVLLQQMFRD